MPDPKSITEESCRTVLLAALRDQIGPGKKWTLEKAADAIDVELRTMRAYLAGENMPGLTKFLRMCALFIPGFANRILRLAGLDGAFRQDAQPITDLQLNGDACALVGELGRALRDGRIDHSERPEVIHEARELRAALDDWLALSESAEASDLETRGNA